MLRALSKWLKENNKILLAKEVDYLIKISEWKDGVPDFNWINNGNIGVLAARYPHEMNEFIELNSDKFAIWDPIKYLGSGQIGDAWLLDDNKVLKIFDNGSKVFGSSDFQKYKEIMDSQHQGSAGANVPMIYEYGLFDVPDSFYNIKSISRRNLGYYEPGYVVMEKVETPADIADKYLDYNVHMFEPGLTYNEELDIYIENENPNSIPLTQEEVLPALQDLYHESFQDGDYEKLIYKFVNTMFDYIINDMTLVLDSEYEKYEEKDHYDDDDDDHDDDYDDDIIDFKDPDSIDYLVDMMSSQISYSEYYNEHNLDALERILNLPEGWINKLAKSLVNNFLKNRKDLHGGNFGFRNKEVVFFDA